MPKDENVRGDEVEKYKLTKEQMSFQQRFAKLKGIQELLQARSLGMAMQAENERALWENLEGEFRKLKPPSKSLLELPGMNFAEEQEEKPAWNLNF